MRGQVDHGTGKAVIIAMTLPVARDLSRFGNASEYADLARFLLSNAYINGAATG